MCSTSEDQFDGVGRDQATRVAAMFGPPHAILCKQWSRRGFGPILVPLFALFGRQCTQKTALYRVLLTLQALHPSDLQCAADLLDSDLLSGGAMASS